VTSLVVGWLIVGSWLVGWLSRACTVAMCILGLFYYGTLIGNSTPGIQWYNFRPPGVTHNRGMGPPWGAFRQITLTSCSACGSPIILVFQSKHLYEIPTGSPACGVLSTDGYIINFAIFDRCLAVCGNDTRSWWSKRGDNRWVAGTGRGLKRDHGER